MTKSSFSKTDAITESRIAPAPVGERILLRTLSNQVIKPLATGIKRMARVKIVLKTLPR